MIPSTKFMAIMVEW